MEILRYNLNDFTPNGEINISIHPDKGLFAIIIIDKQKKKVLAKIKLTKSAYQQFCHHAVFALKKYNELE